MTFRRRMVLLAAVAVAAAIALASVVVYLVTRDELRGQVDSALKELVPGAGAGSVKVVSQMRRGRGGTVLRQQGFDQGFSSGGGVIARVTAPVGADVTFSDVPPGGKPGKRGGAIDSRQLLLPKAKLGGAVGYAQIVTAGGQVLLPGPGGPQLPVDAAARAVAAGRHPAFFKDTKLGGTHIREYIARIPGGGVLLGVRPLTEVDAALRHLTLVLVLVTLAGVALAAVLGLLVSRAALAPVRRLTRETEQVASTQDLSRRIPAGDGDELARLAASFNTMLSALEASRESQRRLVSDASHELRTPLTSVRANLDALALARGLSEQDRARVVAATQAQLAELTVLVGDLVDLSKAGADDAESEDVRLDLAVAEAVARAQLHAPECRFELDSAPCLVRVPPARLHRAVVNLLDNAVKWGPRAGPVEVRVREGQVQVRDHGPGIDEEDMPHVFDRFYRAPAARRLPGSGLGLAIVRQVAESHGGSVRAGDAAGGGALLTFALPTLEMTAEETCGAARLDGAHRTPSSV
jgi:two-component system, OmpR family, sensor histidine kinase MprB